MCACCGEHVRLGGDGWHCGDEMVRKIPSGHWSAAMQGVSAFGNTAAYDTGTIGKCGDDSTQTVSAGQTLYLRAWVGAGTMGTYGRTENQTNHMTKAQVILTEFNSSGQ